MVYEPIKEKVRPRHVVPLTEFGFEPNVFPGKKCPWEKTSRICYFCERLFDIKEPGSQIHPKNDREGFCATCLKNLKEDPESGV